MRRVRGIALLAAVLVGLTACSEWVPRSAPVDCRWVALTDKGGTCQAAIDAEGTEYSFFADMNGYLIGEQVCLCGKPADMTRCKVGQPVDVSHMDRKCPGPPPAY